MIEIIPNKLIKDYIENNNAGEVVHESSIGVEYNHYSKLKVRYRCDITNGKTKEVIENNVWKTVMIDKIHILGFMYNSMMELKKVVIGIITGSDFK